MTANKKTGMGRNIGIVLGAWALLTTGGHAFAQAGAAAGATGTAGQPSGSASTAAPTATAQDAALQKTLQQTYDKCALATKKRDESVLSQVRTPNFVYKEANGKTYTRDQVEDTERRAMTQVQTVQSVSSHVDSVTRENGKATANVRQSFVGTILDAQNKTHQMNMTTVTRDAWTQTKDGWKLQSVQVVSRQDTRDGKTFDPNAAPAAPGNANTGQSTNNGGYRNSGGSSGYRAPAYHAPRQRSSRIKGAGRPVTLP